MKPLKDIGVEIDSVEEFACLISREESSVRVYNKEELRKLLQETIERYLRFPSQQIVYIDEFLKSEGI